jgi:hypothetical protein
VKRPLEAAAKFLDGRLEIRRRDYPPPDFFEISKKSALDLRVELHRG